MRRRVRPNAARDAEIVHLAKQGLPTEAIGRQYGITAERVRQICNRAGLPHDERGQLLAWQQKRQAKQEAEDTRYLARWGLTREQVLTLRSIGATAAYTQQRGNQLKRNLVWGLSLRDWWLIWHESGKWEERGRHRYGMSCYDKAKGFVPGNVFIGTPSECVNNGIKRKATQCAT